IPAEAAAKLKEAVKHVSDAKGFKRIMKKAALLAIYRSPEDGTAATKKLYTELQPIVEEVFAKKK
ncbi:MAG: hypothetical protein ACR2PH_17650, partial [Desulfobulbia bacterium]